MPRRTRIQYSGAYYHVYNRGVNKGDIVSDNRDRKVFMQLLGESVQQFHLRLFAYCLMGNHFHLFLQTKEANLDKAMWYLLSNFSRCINLRYERVGPLFQSRYQARVVNTDQYALILTRYIHQNSIQAGVVHRMEDYPWSSYPSYLQKLPRWSWLEVEWVLRQFDSNPDNALSAFRQFHKHKPAIKEQRKLVHFRTPLC